MMILSLSQNLITKFSRHFLEVKRMPKSQWCIVTVMAFQDLRPNSPNPKPRKSQECGQSLNHLMIMGLDQYQSNGKEVQKLIGAKYFMKGFLAANKGCNFTKSPDYISARDFDGHGTHVASIAGGSYITNVSYRGLSGRTLRGGAPRARIAMYKACWFLKDPDDGTCLNSDIIKAIDEAIHDGVDVLSISLSGRVPLFPETDLHNAIATGFFHAVAKGIEVVCAGGNNGPATQTVSNTSPWILTEAATTLDRSFPTPIILGNNQMILGQATYTGPELDFTSLVYPWDTWNSGVCESLNLNLNHTMARKVVLCFTTLRTNTAISRASSVLNTAGGIGLIVSRNPVYTLAPCDDDFPCIAIDYELGTDILSYIRSTRYDETMDCVQLFHSLQET